MERMGEKYQWIAYREFLARESDNLALRRRYPEKEDVQYEGTWQIGHGPDIDPSCLLTKIEKRRRESI